MIVLIDFYFRSKIADQRLSMRSKDINNMQLKDVIKVELKSINTMKVQENLKLNILQGYLLKILFLAVSIYSASLVR